MVYTEIVIFLLKMMIAFVSILLLKCASLTTNDVVNKTKEELDISSFAKINNYFTELSFGDVQEMFM